MNHYSHSQLIVAMAYLRSTVHWFLCANSKMYLMLKIMEGSEKENCSVALFIWNFSQASVQSPCFHWTAENSPISSLSGSHWQTLWHTGQFKPFLCQSWGHLCTENIHFECYKDSFAFMETFMNRGLFLQLLRSFVKWMHPLNLCWCNWGLALLLHFGAYSVHAQKI